MNSQIGLDPRTRGAAALSIPLVMLAAAICSADPPASEPRIRGKTPETIRFYPQTSGIRPSFGGGYFNLSAGRVETRTVTYTARLDVHEFKYDIDVQYRLLLPDEVIPITGVLYKITRIGPGKEMIVDRVDEQELPDGVTLRKDTLAVPTNGTMRLGWWHKQFNALSVWFYVESIEAAKERGESPVATVDAYYSLKDGHGDTVHYRKLGVKIRKGDVLAMRDGGLKVVNIVPRDETTGIRGWVEFDPKPVAAEGRFPPDAKGK